MIEEIRHLLEIGAAIIEGLAAALIIFGFIVTLSRYFSKWTKENRETGFHRLRGELGRVLLVALELLVVADVIDTIVTQVTVRSLSVLALLVVLRTILSWNLALQVEGKWPWQPGKDKEQARNA